MSSDAGEFEFGPFRIDSSERLLHRGDELIPLPPKAADTLLALLSSAGRMVDKGELLETVWPDTFVEEGSLTRNISLLRKTLGDAMDEAVFIRSSDYRTNRPSEFQPRTSDGERVLNPAIDEIEKNSHRTQLL